MLVLKSDGSPAEIRDEEILFFSSYQNTIFVHTEEGEFIYPISLSDLCAAYQMKGFEKLDRSNVVNTPKVTAFDSIRKIVLFGVRDDLYAAVSAPNEKKAKKIIEAREKADST